MRMKYFWFLIFFGNPLILIAQTPEGISEMDALIESGEACEIMMMFAKQIMTARQNGANVAEVMKIGDNIGGLFYEHLNELTLQAYEMSRFSTPRNQQIAIDDFANDFYVSCVRSAQN